MVTDSIIFQFARLSNLYQEAVGKLIRLAIFLVLLFLIFSFTNSGTQIKVPLALLSLLLIIEVFMKFKIEKTPPDRVSFAAAKIIVSSKDCKSLCKKLLQMASIKFLLNKCDIKSKEIPIVDTDLNLIFKKAGEITKAENLSSISSVELLIAYLLQIEENSKLLFSKELKPQDLLNISYWARMHFNEEPTKIRVKFWGEGIGEEWVSGWTLELRKYAVDFTKKTLRSLNGFYDRNKELELLIEAFLKSEKQNVILVGEPGVGKTAIVKALTQKVFLGGVPGLLSHKLVLELSAGSLVAGADNQGILEERIKNIIEELTHAGNIILFIPEIQNIAGASMGLDATGVLLPLLKSNKVQVIATSTPQNYKAFVESKTSFAQTFEKIEVLQPERDNCLKILEEAALTFEKKHKINITYKAILAAYELAQRYMLDRFLPGKAIDLLDSAAASIVINKKKDLEEKDIIALIEAKTHVAVGPPKKEEKQTLLNLEKILHQRIINQEEAVKAVSEALRRLRGGISFEDRPIGTFLFLGPTGVGKTATAKALSNVYFGSEASKRAERPFGSEAMIRFDMSEYQYEASVERLLNQLVDRIRQQPFSLLLLDEFEKAHPKILDIFLQVFEDGRLTDSQGRTASFVNTIIIATSNAGAELIREKISQGKNLQELKPLILDELQRLGVFKPELLNRLDSLVLFEPLGKKEIMEITKLILAKLADSLREKDIYLSFDEKVITKIAQEGFEQTMGARPLRRFIQDNIENLLAQKILKEEIKRGDKVLFSTDGVSNITVSILDG